MEVKLGDEESAPLVLALKQHIEKNPGAVSEYLNGRDDLDIQQIVKEGLLETSIFNEDRIDEIIKEVVADEFSEREEAIANVIEEAVSEKLNAMFRSLQDRFNHRQKMLILHEEEDYKDVVVRVRNSDYDETYQAIAMMLSFLKTDEEVDLTTQEIEPDDGRDDECCGGGDRRSDCCTDAGEFDHR